ncbi:MAG: TonB-dependent receptor [Gemmatimonadota bacterium]
MIELALIAVTTLGTLGGDGSVRGTVLSDRHEPVAGVQIELPAQNRVTWSDAAGRYELRDVEPGEHEIRFTRFAYDPLTLTVTVPTGHTLDLDVRLRTRFVVQPGISVLASLPAARPPTLLSSGLPEVGSREIPVDVVWSSPLVGQPDVLATLRTVSGIDLAEESATQIHVRGGSADQNLVLLDGAPVYNGYHNSGILSAVSPDAISGMVVHTGVMPARYGGRLSSVVDLRTRAPVREGIQVRGGAGVPDLRLALQAPLPGDAGGVLLAGRRTTYDLVRRGYARGTEASGFEDVLGKLDLGVLGGTLSMVALHTDNWLSSSAGAAGDDDVPIRFPEGFPDLHNSVGWSTGTDAFTWSSSSEGGSEVVFRLFRSSYRSNIEWGSLDEGHRMHSRLVHWGGSGELAWKRASSEDRAGVAVERLSTDYRTAGSVRGNPSPADAFALSARPTVVASWVERRWIPRDRWLVNGGLRAIHVEGAGFGLEPRLSAHYRTGDRVTVSAGFGRVHQVLQSLTNEESLLNAAYAVEPLVAAGPGGVPMARSDQLAAAFETRLAEGLRLTVDGYVRRMEGLVLVAAATTEPYATAGFERGRGAARGLGAELAYEGKRLAARAVVEWSSVRRTAGGVTYHPGFERRRSLALEGAYRVFRSTSLTSAFQVAAGRPTSPLDGGFDWEIFDQLTGEVEFRGTPRAVPGPLNVDRLPPYARLDLGVRRDWRVEGPGPDGTITAYLNLLNVLDHENVLGRQLSSPGSPAHTLVLMPRSLLFGVEWSF